MTNLSVVFLMAAKGELMWTWCPVCGNQQDHLQSDNGQWRCTRCGTAHPVPYDPKTDKEVKP